MFDLFTSILDIVLHNARIEGQLDSGIVDIRAKNVEMKESPKVKFYCDDICFGSSISLTINECCPCRLFTLIACLVLRRYYLLSPSTGELLGR